MFELGISRTTKSPRRRIPKYDLDEETAHCMAIHLWSEIET